MAFKVSDLDLPAPLEYHPTMDVNDSSKIQAFMDCPRGFFFRYIAGLESEEPNKHLVFGSAWHEAMEYLMINGLSNESVMNAYEKFMDTFLEGYPNEMMHDELAPKNPEYALKALAAYAVEYRDYDKDNETLITEIAGTVPISPERVIHAKVDTVIRAPDGIWSLEHKTTGRNSRPWREKWDLIVQTGTYTHLINALYPDEQVQGVKINGTVFTKSRGHDFLRIPVRKTASDMQEYLWEVNHWLDLMEWNYKELAQSSVSEPVMMAFPKNSQSCSKFGCRYPGMCSNMCNPLQHLDEEPLGYQKNFWDPRREDKDAKHEAKPDKDGNMQLTKIEKEEKDDSTNS